VWGMVNDKDVSKTLEILPKEATYYLCKPDVPRGLEVSVLAERASEIGLRNNSYSTVHDALNAAKSHAKIEDIIYVGGSTFVVAETV
jgi:dihydrofolate synthase/folylpolyglutamate synthase